jgi:hypothetical protein
MNTNPRDVIIQVLSIVDYKNDKEAAVDKFLSICEKLALINLIDSLTGEEKTNLQQKLTTVQEGTDEYNDVTKQYFTEEKYSQAIKKAGEKVFAEYLSSIMGSLSSEQQNKLFQYLGSLAPQQTA